jgi:hypothetical protein
MWCGKCYSSKNELEFFIADEAQLLTAADGDDDRLASGWIARKDDKDRYVDARDGDDLLVSFECDVCIFQKLWDREPNSELEVDKLAMMCIRHVNLDAFWSRARSTVGGNAGKVREGLRQSEKLGLKGPYLAPGPLPPYDHCGYEVAMQIVLSSTGAGRYSPSHKQWDTVRKLRTCFSNQVRAAAVANYHPMTLADNNGSVYQRMSIDPCGSLWFQRFMTGCRRRMGQDWRPNRAISVEIMSKLLKQVRDNVKATTTNKDWERWVMAGTYFAFCYVVGLRGPEGLLADLEGLIEHFSGTSKYVIIPLLGRVKGEHHSKQHLIPCVSVTDSGIEVESWMRQVLALHRIRGRTRGPLFVNKDGYQSTTRDMNDLFLESLGEIFKKHPELFAVDIKSTSDLFDKYNVFRSFRRGSESRAVAKKVSEPDRYIVHRWKRKEAAGANRASHNIDQHYVDITLVEDSFVRYTQAM